LTFATGHLDSGDYAVRLEISDGVLRDTLRLTVHVNAAWVTLTVVAEHGTVTVQPRGARHPQYRWGDTLTLAASPDSGYQFAGWSGALSGQTDTMSLVLLRAESVTALFELLAGSCVPVAAGGSLNQAIRDACAQRPRDLCPEPGLYENGTVRVFGTTRLVIR
jgi:hypothetical protein